MRIVVQRVREAAVEVDGEEVARIAQGLLVLVGVGLSVVHWRPRPSRGTLATAGVASGFLATSASVGLSDRLCLVEISPVVRPGKTCNNIRG